MNTALQVVGALLVIDLVAAFMLLGLVALVGRRGRRAPLKMLFGPILFLAFCSALVYGSLWLILRWYVD